MKKKKTIDCIIHRVIVLLLVLSLLVTSAAVLRTHNISLLQARAASEEIPDSDAASVDDTAEEESQSETEEDQSETEENQSETEEKQSETEENQFETEEKQSETEETQADVALNEPDAEEQSEISLLKAMQPGIFTAMEGLAITKMNLQSSPNQSGELQIVMSTDGSSLGSEVSLYVAPLNSGTVYEVDFGDGNKRNFDVDYLGGDFDGSIEGNVAGSSSIKIYCNRDITILQITAKITGLDISKATGL